MSETDKSIMSLFLIGLLIAVGKILISGKPISLGQFTGRLLLGGFVSMIAGVALIQFPTLSSIAIDGIGAALGIAGYQTIELFLQRRARDQGDKDTGSDKNNNNRTE
ncbi:MULTISPECIES: phage holin family protein [Lonsdalea]|uniref:Holin n=2 Tax=Lonsdalea TaxID=1082702 RepID=A0ACD1JBF7_9GAMM|nr:MULTISPECIES: phage holin family protein [Lonsdalea]OSN01456.1 holin [Lonsdalea populi]QPQ22784.1 phage holin family protein [Lonsdalea populi]RAT12940.1 holin [Lonsdalea quercina]RAT15303.1 holin [Lonsdalea quercina]RAT20723.1 holin [Lonsdalea populi]